jgi:predicted nucleic acid-binding Zn ribbon protein
MTIMRTLTLIVLLGAAALGCERGTASMHKDSGVSAAAKDSGVFVLDLRDAGARAAADKDSGASYSFLIHDGGH